MELMTLVVAPATSPSIQPDHLITTRISFRYFPFHITTPVSKRKCHDMLVQLYNGCCIVVSLTDGVRPVSGPAPARRPGADRPRLRP